VVHREIEVGSTGRGLAAGESPPPYAQRPAARDQDSHSENYRVEERARRPRGERAYDQLHQGDEDCRLCAGSCNVLWGRRSQRAGLLEPQRRQRAGTGKRGQWNRKPNGESSRIAPRRYRHWIKPWAQHSVTESRCGQRSRRDWQCRRHRPRLIRHGSPVVACRLRHQLADGFGEQRRVPGNEFGDESSQQAKAERQCRSRFIERPCRDRGVQDKSRRKSLSGFSALWAARLPAGRFGFGGHHHLFRRRPRIAPLSRVVRRWHPGRSSGGAGALQTAKGAAGPHLKGKLSFTFRPQPIDLK